MKNTLKYIWLNVLPPLFITLLLGTCTTVMVISDMNEKKIKDKTVFVKITDKDFIDYGATMFDNNIKPTVYFKRYDIDTNYIDCGISLNETTVTDYKYKLLEVGKLYRYSYLKKQH